MARLSGTPAPLSRGGRYDCPSLPSRSICSRVSRSLWPVARGRRACVWRRRPGSPAAQAPWREPRRAPVIRRAPSEGLDPTPIRVRNLTYSSNHTLFHETWFHDVSLTEILDRTVSPWCVGRLVNVPACDHAPDYWLYSATALDAGRSSRRTPHVTNINSSRRGGGWVPRRKLCVSEWRLVIRGRAVLRAGRYWKQANRAPSRSHFKRAGSRHRAALPLAPLPPLSLCCPVRLFLYLFLQSIACRTRA